MHPGHPGFAANLPAFPANLRKQLKGAPMEAPRAIMAAAVEGSQVDVDNALLIESRYFTKLVTGRVAKNMIQAFFFDMQAIGSGASRPKDIPKREIKKVGVLGAGMMGAGIAYVCAKAGIPVVLKDVTIEAAEKGKAYSEKIEAKALSRGKTTERIEVEGTAVADHAVRGCGRLCRRRLRGRGGLRVSRPEEEGVPGDRGHRRARRAARLEHLDAADHRPRDRRQAVRGLHRHPLFLAGDKMPLVEIIRGEKTVRRDPRRVFDFVQAIRKTPIVVNDSRGFFTSRVIGNVRQRGHRHGLRSIEPATIEQAGMQAGYRPRRCSSRTS